ncbi:PSME3 protein, partial [Atractosteus spatula]|nr:PSME3 protein [Atractosteus spatula]
MSAMHWEARRRQAVLDRRVARMRQTQKLSVETKATEESEMRKPVKCQEPGAHTPVNEFEGLLAHCRNYGLCVADFSFLSAQNLKPAVHSKSEPSCNEKYSAKIENRYTAEDLVANFFPKKLLELDHFLKDPILNIIELKDIHSEINLSVPDPIILTNSHDGLEPQNTKKRKLEDGAGDDNCQVTGTKVFVMPGGMMKSNNKLVDLIEKVKPEIRTLIEKCNTVKMWVQLLIPRIEDGNNFGVSIQEETVAELRTVEGEAASYLDQISRYYITRAKLVSKIAKYPHVEDYRRTVTEIDEKEYISLKIIVSELRNQYVTLHDMILKNIEKIKRPRSSNAETLY